MRRKQLDEEREKENGLRKQQPKQPDQEWMNEPKCVRMKAEKEKKRNLDYKRLT